MSLSALAILGFVKLIVFLTYMRGYIFSSSLRVKLKLVCFVALVGSISFQYGKEDTKLKRSLGFSHVNFS